MRVKELENILIRCKIRSKERKILNINTPKQISISHGKHFNSINWKMLLKLKIKRLRSHVKLKTTSYLAPNYILLSQIFSPSVVQFCLDPMPIITTNKQTLSIYFINQQNTLYYLKRNPQNK